MAAKRRARRPRSDDSKELGRNGGNEGSDEEEEESGKSGETTMSAEPKEMPLKQAEQPSPPSTKDAGAQGSGEASPARSAPRGGVALKTETTLKHVKKPPPASQVPMSPVSLALPASKHVLSKEKQQLVGKEAGSSVQ